MPRYLLPVDSSEEVVASDLLPTLRSVSWVFLEQPPNQLLARFRHRKWELYFLVLDRFLNLLLVVRIKGWEATDHLIKQAPKRVEVHRFIVRVSQQHLRTEIFWGTTKSVRIVVSSSQFFGQSEVSELDMPVDTDQDVLWLQISIKHVLRVKCLECFHGLYYIKQGHVFCELLPLRKPVEQLTADTQVHDEEEFGFWRS